MSTNQFRLSRKALLSLLLISLYLLSNAWILLAKQDQDKGAAAAKYFIEFKDAKLRNVLSVLGKQGGIDVLFDETFRDDLLTIKLDDTTINAALKIILDQKKLQARLKEEKTILVFPNNEKNRQRFEQYKVWPVEPEKK